MTPVLRAEAPRRFYAPKYLLAQPNASAPAPIIRAGNDKVPNEYIVVLRDDLLPDQVADRAREVAHLAGAVAKDIWSYALKGFYAVMSEAQAIQVSRNPHVKYVEENARWYLSATQQTNIDPRVCNPTAGPCSPVLDDRLWHLDRADQNYASPNNAFSYCSDGTGVTVYVIDTGVSKFHNEFAPGGSRIKAGFNASNDQMPADDPCLGFAVPAIPGTFETSLYPYEVLSMGHGTAVASALGGLRVGVAKNVTIVPIKVARCDQYSARLWIANHYYQKNETIFRGAYAIDTLYRVISDGGYSSGTDPGNWKTGDNETVPDNQLTWQVVPRSEWQQVQTTTMLIAGVNWILSPGNPWPKSPAVATLSTFRLPSDPDVTKSGGLEDGIRSLLTNNITVIASANNQNGNACDTSPARLSRNNPDPSLANDVITVGGSMMINRPWAVDISDVPNDAHEADGPKPDGTYYGVEAAYDQSKAVRDSRWICGPGDSALKCTNFSATATPNPSDNASYYAFTGGSNAGACVTLFAPAKNLFLASTAGADEYRDARLRGTNASGTSWSAPIVAGFAARILQNNPAYTPVQVRSALLSNSVSTLDPDTLNTRDHTGAEITGTPNKLLQFGDVNITNQPASTPGATTGTTRLEVAAAGTSTVNYQWYEVNAAFDYATYQYGAHSSSALAGQTSNIFQAPASNVRKAYWVRVTGSCGSADSNIAVVVPAPSSPSNVQATAYGASVTVTWSPGSGADNYEVQRKIAGQPWTVAGHVDASSLTFTETPTAPGGMIVYRVLATAGAAYLPPDRLATSSPSNNDFANVASYAYESLAIPPGFTTVKAQHLIELRQAVNALCSAVGAPLEYEASDLALSALQGNVVQATDFTSLMTHINNIRTNALIGTAAFSFTETPASNLVISSQHLHDLRNALN